MSPSTIVLGVLALVSLCLTGTLSLIALWTMRRPNHGPRNGAGHGTSSGAAEISALPAPPISVLKPLKGASPDLYDNLAAFARQDYPRFELLLGTTDPDDPAVAVAERVRRDFPGVAIRVVAQRPRDAQAAGFNPKVINLAQLTAAARYELLLVSDADIRPDVGYLASLGETLAGNDRRGRRRERPIGLVTHAFLPAGESSVGAVFETLHLAGFVTPSLSAAARIARRPCVVGKSMLMTRRALAAAGGWDAVRDVLAEDYVLGRDIHRAGYRVVLARRPLTTWDPRRPLRAFAARHLRWAQMRARIAPAAYLGELALNPTPLVLAWAAAAVLDGMPRTAVALTLAALGARGAVDGLLIRRLRGSRMRTRHLALGPAKDLLIFGTWMAGACRRTIVWRGTRLAIGRGSVLRRLPTRSRRAEPPSHPLTHSGRAA